MDTPDIVEEVVKSNYGAGRMQKGDLPWTFDNATQDANDNIISELKTALQNYKPTLVGFFGNTDGDHDAASITTTVSPHSVTAFYNLQGQRIKGNNRGIAIIGRKKVITNIISTNDSKETQK